ncbi:hypothetical protein Tcan_02001 [Toxocara canis]|uniref:Uncharacterized protein n=1 Tax=Toxocara canis TaxID=6265 RepID=A0A0B2VN59_TOXCA|nr:hypothetical protein Tcan_02001 [Toxocara canis]
MRWKVLEISTTLGGSYNPQYVTTHTPFKDRQSGEHTQLTAPLYLVSKGRCKREQRFSRMKASPICWCTQATMWTFQNGSEKKSSVKRTQLHAPWFQLHSHRSHNKGLYKKHIDLSKTASVEDAESRKRAATEKDHKQHQQLVMATLFANCIQRLRIPSLRILL